MKLPLFLTSFSALLALQPACSRSPESSPRDSSETQRVHAGKPAIGIGYLKPRAIGLAAEGHPWITHLAISDLDRDGLQDVVVCEGRLNQVSWVRQSAKGIYVEAAIGSPVQAPVHVEAVDFDRDGDVDLLLTTNNGPAVLLRNDQLAGNKSVRLRLTGTTSNRDAIGALVRVFYGGASQARMVKSGSSYLSQSELPLTFGVGRRDRVDRIEVTWPNGRTEDFKNVASGRAYDCVEGKGLAPARP